MELITLFSALSEVIFYSIFQGLFVYAFVKFILKVFPELPSSERYKILYTGMIWIFASFIISFSNVYLKGLEELESNVQMQAFDHQTSLARAFEANMLLPGFSTWIAVLYFAGLLIQFVMLVFGLFRVNTIRKKSLKKVDYRWHSQLNILSKKLKLDRKVTLSISNDTLIPCTIGFLKPIILFPVAIINNLSPGEVEAILLHELAHIMRKDYLFNIIQRMMEMVLFFNPVIWFIGKEIRREREFCCDDLVLQNTSNPLIYAKALLHIAENKSNNLKLSLAASGADKYTLFNRIKRLTNMKTMNSNPKPHLFTTLTVIAVCLSLAWIIPAEQVIKHQKNNRTAISQFQPDTVRLELPAVPNAAEAPPIAPVPSIHSKPELALAPLAPKVPKVPQLSVPSVIPYVPEPNAIPFPPDTNKLKKKLNSPEWKKNMEEMKSHAEEMKKHFESPEWKKQIVDMKANAEQMKSQTLAMEKEFNNPEWKKKIEDMKNHSLEMKKHFESPEWKKQIADMKANAEQMKSQTLAMEKEFNNPEWKKKIENMKNHSLEMKKQFDSPEWKKQIEEMKLNSEQIRKQFESPE
ncbi:MAG: M48 family metalloprotease [Phormidesmis sp. FL-bin-119]|nr:M48 family metalloprotease [Pedobacter sp.]